MKPNAIGTLVLASFLVSTAYTTAPQAQSNLGTSAKLAQTFSADYLGMVQAALPTVTAAELTQKLRAVERASAQTPPMKIDSLRRIEQFFDLPEAPLTPGQTRVDGEVAAYAFEPAPTRLYLAFRRVKSQPLPRAEFARSVPEIRRVHAQLLLDLGINPKEVFFQDFRETLAQANANPSTLGGKELPILSDGASTLTLRAVEGLQVERSKLLVSSIDPQQLEMVTLEWPPVRLAPSIWQSGVSEPKALARSIAQRIATQAQGSPVNVRMAVVLRNIDVGASTVFVPALRVGVQPQPVVQRDGESTEAGDIFYVDLIPQSPADPERGNGREETTVDMPTKR